MGVRVPSSASFKTKKVRYLDSSPRLFQRNKGGLPVRVSCTVRLINSPTLQDESLHRQVLKYRDLHSKSTGYNLVILRALARRIFLVFRYFANAQYDVVLKIYSEICYISSNKEDFYKNYVCDNIVFVENINISRRGTLPNKND